MHDRFDFESPFLSSLPLLSAIENVAMAIPL
jgi:hypothetical protein